jgi:hypothetical protein
MKILSIEFVFGANESAEDLEDEDDRYSDRWILVRFSTGFCGNENSATISPCQESWEIVGGWEQINSELVAIADRFNPWLHGGELCATINE